jgi:hypothetical protein
MCVYDHISGWANSLAFTPTETVRNRLEGGRDLRLSLRSEEEDELCWSSEDDNARKPTAKRRRTNEKDDEINNKLD